MVDPDKPGELVVGPYQGTLGCLRIAFGKGVCGTAAAERRTVIVPDVEAFPGHIACDSRSRSEIVVPVTGPDGRLLAVLDVDSAALAAFGRHRRGGAATDRGRGVRAVKHNLRVRPEAAFPSPLEGEGGRRMAAG